MSDLVALSFDLVTTHNEVQLVLFQETLCHIWPELTTHSSLADGTAILNDKQRKKGKLIISQSKNRNALIVADNLLKTDLRLWI